MTSLVTEEVVHESRSNHQVLDSYKTFKKIAAPRVRDGLASDVASAGITENMVKSDVERLYKDGYIIIENLLSPEELQQVREGLRPHLGSKLGRNLFEGTRTRRVYGLLGKGRHFDRLAAHPRILAILDRVLEQNFLVTAAQAIEIHPGESRQPYHYDDGFCHVPRPRKPFGCATIWAIDDFTADNGATVVFPQSHTWGAECDDRVEEPGERPIPVVMPAGSVVVFLSTLMHGGGANSTTDCPRLGVTFQYCEPWIRPQENCFLAVPFDQAKAAPARIQSMLGYSIHPPFIGHVCGEHPLKALAKM